MSGSLAPDGAAPDEMRWLSIAAAIASISVVGIAIGLGVPLLSVILETRGHSASMIGLNTAVAGLASIAAAPLATPLALRFGVVSTMLLMIVSGALAFVGFYFAPSFWMWFPLAGRAACRTDCAVHPFGVLDQHLGPATPTGVCARHLCDSALARLRLRTVAFRTDGQRRVPALRRHLRPGDFRRPAGAGSLEEKSGDP